MVPAHWNCHGDAVDTTLHLQDKRGTRQASPPPKSLFPAESHFRLRENGTLTGFRHSVNGGHPPGVCVRVCARANNSVVWFPGRSRMTMLFPHQQHRVEGGGREGGERRTCSADPHTRPGPPVLVTECWVSLSRADLSGFGRLQFPRRGVSFFQ